MKATLSEIKWNLYETNSGGHETKIHINDLDHEEEKRIQKNEDSVRITSSIPTFAL